MRSNKKRQAILDIAYGLFCEKGFEKTSMSEIWTLVGGSKATIYSHFSTKENLFVECMFAVVSTYMDGIFSGLRDQEGDPRSVLKAFGEAVVVSSCSPEMISIRRLVIAEAGRAGVGKLFYERIQSLLKQVAVYLSDLMSRGVLRPENADLAANYLRTLLEAELIEPVLLCAADSQPDEEAIVSVVARAIDTFLRAYEPRTMHEASACGSLVSLVAE